MLPPPPALPEVPPAEAPLVVRLERVLVRTDLAQEALLLLLKQRPLLVLLLPLWLLRGWAFLQREVARRVALDVVHLPYCTALVEALRAEHARGRPLLLLSSGDALLAEAVASHLGVFSAVLAGDGRSRLRGALLRERLHGAARGGFALASDAREARALWAQARGAWVVGAAGVQALRPGTPVRTVDSPRGGLRRLPKALRVHQWAKNALLFVPLLAAHRATEGALVLRAVEGFVAFCLCASSVYLLNDLLDLPSDRRHPTKCRRPFAAGDLPVSLGLVLIPVLLAASAALAILRLPPAFLGMLGVYYAATLAYSFHLKQVMVLDVLVLAGLYTVRIFAGALAVGVPTSNWLLGFSMFFFLSLALVKRVAEVRELKLAHREAAHGRGYVAEDYAQLGNLGVSAGYLAVVVLALYISGGEVAHLYRHPGRLWLLCPVLVYWLSRVWLLVHRGDVDEDPLVFALKDRVSYLVGALAALVLLLAT